MSHLLPKSKSQPKNLRPKRFIIIGDTHFGVGANDEYFFRSMVMYVYTVLIPWLEENLKPGDVIVLTGDIFDNDTTLRIEIHDAVLALFERMAGLAPVVIIVGNHDIVRKRSNEVNSLRGIGQIDGVYVYYQPTIWECDFDRKVLFYPWAKTETLDDFKIAAADGGCSVMVSHAHYNGLAFDNEFVKKVNGEIQSINVQDLKMFDIVINGHIHRKQDLMNVMNVGSPWQLTFNDDKNMCGFHVLGLEKLDKTFIENTYSPRFMNDEIGAILNMTKKEAMEKVNNKLVKLSYPAELAKTFSLDMVRKELETAISVEFLPEYHYSNNDSVKMSDIKPEIVDLKKIIGNVANMMQLPDAYTDSLVDELHEMYMQNSKIEAAEI